MVSLDRRISRCTLEDVRACSTFLQIRRERQLTVCIKKFNFTQEDAGDIYTQPNVALYRYSEVNVNLALFISVFSLN